MPMATVAPQGGVLLQSRKLAPAPDRTSVLVVTPQTTSDGRCRKKINFNHLPYTGPGPQPASVARRNARERNRVKQVNNGFATLRQHIPPSVAATVIGNSGRGASKKLSKVDTLKLAVEYIRSLQQLLDDHDSETGSTVTVTELNSYDSRSYYAGSPDSSATEHPGHPVLISHTPPSSEASVSPSPSFASENSPPVYAGYPSKYHHHHHQTDAGGGGGGGGGGYDNYEPMSPEDEELLDAIFHWQQQ